MATLKTFLTFENQALEAAEFYVSIFPNSRVERVNYYQAGARVAEGTVMAVVFTLDGRDFVALNGGPHFSFSEGMSISVECEHQGEIDYFWARLTEGGSPGPCGWLKDRFGVSWQVVPSMLQFMLSDHDADRVKRVSDAFLTMSKLDLETLEHAYQG